MICHDTRDPNNTIGVSELTDPFYRFKHAVSLDPEVIAAHGPTPSEGETLAEIPAEMEAHINKVNELYA